MYNIPLIPPNTIFTITEVRIESLKSHQIWSVFFTGQETVSCKHFFDSFSFVFIILGFFAFFPVDHQLISKFFTYFISLFAVLFVSAISIRRLGFRQFHFFWLLLNECHTKNNAINEKLLINLVVIIKTKINKKISFVPIHIIVGLLDCLVLPYQELVWALFACSFNQTGLQFCFFLVR